MFQQLFNQMSKTTDVFNLGRFVFYTAAGMLVLTPVLMIFSLLGAAELKNGLFAQLNVDAGVILQQSTSFYLFFWSIVIGFLIASMAFTTTGDDADVQVRATVEKKLQDDEKKAHSFPYNYPLLRNDTGDGKQDYSAWLISEYYRYLEIVTVIPIGAMTGLFILEVYVGLYITKQAASAAGTGFTEAHATFLGLLVLLAYIKYYFWPKFWVRHVVVGVTATFLIAKGRVIQGLRDSNNT